VFPDTTYLERHDCISLLDRPICDADGAADAIRQPVVKAERDVRPFQDVLLELGVRLKLPALIKADGSAKFPGGFPDYIANHERSPGVGMLAGFRGAEGNQSGTGAPNPKQVEAYIANGCFWRQEIEPSHRYYRFANKGYLDWAVKMGFLGKADPVVMQLYSEPLQKFRNAARGHGAVQPPDRDRKRIETYFDPLPFWYPPFEGALVDDDAFPMHAITQRPMAMYHSWGSQNAWLRQIHTANRLHLNRQRATQLGLVDDDWVWVTSHHGRIKVQIKLAEGVNPDTAWTWNAIGKRRGAWALDNDAPESRKGFLLNHLISELLPPQPDGHRYANSDPITGQAAWYDLRVRIEKARESETAESVPQFEAAKRPPGMMEKPDILRYGAGFRR
jgi:anaerobic selenocysteine-containing dehydrogenase